MYMTKYGNVAIKAVELFRTQNESNLVDAWNIAAKEIFKDKDPSIKKPCPKDTFLGLCEEGLIKDIPSGKYTMSKSNKAYALATVELLKECDIFEKCSDADIWKKVLKKCKTDPQKKHNGQLPVIRALFENGLLNL